MTAPHAGYRARALVAMLRQCRERREVSGNQLAKRLGVNQSTVSRWDNGHLIPTPDDVVRILDALDVAGEERATILALAEPVGEHTRLYGAHGASPQLAAVMDAERDARRMTEYNPLVVPRILQTADYARTVTADPTVSRADHAIRTILLAGRRDALTRRKDPVHLLALIGEPAVRGRLGGPLVMLDQLWQIQRYARLSTVTVQVVGLRSEEWHPGYLPGFCLYQFAPPLPTMLYMEHLATSEFLLDTPLEPRVQRYLDAVPWLQRAAYSEADSLALIAEQISVLERS